MNFCFFKEEMLSLAENGGHDKTGASHSAHVPRVWPPSHRVDQNFSFYCLALSILATVSPSPWILGNVVLQSQRCFVQNHSCLSSRRGSHYHENTQCRSYLQSSFCIEDRAVMKCQLLIQETWNFSFAAPGSQPVSCTGSNHRGGQAVIRYFF